MFALTLSNKNPNKYPLTISNIHSSNAKELKQLGSNGPILKKVKKVIANAVIPNEINPLVTLRGLKKLYLEIYDKQKQLTKYHIMKIGINSRRVWRIGSLIKIEELAKVPPKCLNPQSKSKIGTRKIRIIANMIFLLLGFNISLICISVA